MQENFKSDLSDFSTFGTDYFNLYGDHDYTEQGEWSATINWNLTITASTYGVTSIQTHIVSISGTHTEVVYYKNDDYDEEPTEVKATFVSFTDDKYCDKLTYSIKGQDPIIFDVELALEWKDNELWPDKIELNFKELKCYIS